MDDLQKIFLSSEGRLNRLQYFKFTMILIIVETVANSIFSDDYGNISDNLDMLITLAFLVPEYFLNVRRIHDFAGDEILAKLMVALTFYSMVFNSGADNMYMSDNLSFGDFLSSMPMDSYVYSALWFYLLFNPGTKGANQYGDEPL